MASKAGLLAASIAALLPTRAAAAAPHAICADAADWQGSKTTYMRWGADKTCQEWYDAYKTELDAFQAAPSLDTCNARIEIAVENAAGFFPSALFILQRILASEPSFMCCGQQEKRSFPCEDLVMQESCPETHTFDGAEIPVLMDDGACTPCYGMPATDEWDGEARCNQCWELQTEGCTEQQCSAYGTWEAGEKKCRVCSEVSYDGCSSSDCAALGAAFRVMTMGEETRCSKCDLANPFGDTMACRKDECVGDNLNWVEQGEYSRCGRCDPIGDYGSCSQDQCKGDGLIWKCWDHGECRCEKCSLSDRDGSINSCTRETCQATDEFPDVMWVESEHRESRCSRCADMGDRVQLDACKTKAACEAVPGAAWNCGDDEESFDCCQECSTDNPWGCKSMESCASAGGMLKVWSEEHMECLVCRPEHNDIRGCAEDRCLASDNNYWICIGEECECQKCDMMGEDGGSPEACPESVCTSAAYPDAMMKNSSHWRQINSEEWGEIVIMQCARCFKQEMRTFMSGCETEKLCTAVEGFLWDSDCHTQDSGCCRPCVEGQYWGCEEEASCRANGGRWCEHEGGHMSCDGACPKTCGKMRRENFEELRASGFEPREMHEMHECMRWK